MNFTSPSDFQFVTGDLDKIAIDNEIMPVRSSADKRIVRGMDIAFLMEAVEERRRAIGLTAKTWTFSREITKSQLDEIQDGISELYESVKFISSYPETSKKEPYHKKTVDDAISDLLYDGDDFVRIVVEDEMKSSDIMQLYTYVGNIKLYKRSTASLVLNKEETENNYEDITSQGETIRSAWYNSGMIGKRIIIRNAAHYDYYGTERNCFYNAEYSKNNTITFNGSGTYAKECKAFSSLYMTTVYDLDYVSTETIKYKYWNLFLLSDLDIENPVTYQTLANAIIDKCEENGYFVEGLYPINANPPKSQFLYFSVNEPSSILIQTHLLLCNLRDRTRWDDTSAESN